MHALHADRRLLWLILFCCAGSTAYFVGYALATNFYFAARELGPVQLHQLAALAGAAILFPWLGEGVPRVVGLGVAILCSYFFLREADFRELGPDFWGAFLDDRGFKTVWHAATAIAYGVYLWLRRDLIPGAIRYGFSREAWPFWLAAATLVAAEIVERIYLKVWKVGGMEFTEEALESASFTILLVTAIWFLRNAWRPRPSPV